MSAESFTFHCPACGAKLSLPMSLAGVVGPCPSCRTRIQAPSAEMVRAHLGALRLPPAAPVGADQPPPQRPLAPMPASAPAPMPAPTPAPAAGEPPPGYGSRVKIEPRELPARGAPTEPVARPIAEPDTRPLPASHRRIRRKAAPWRRTVVPLVFLAAAVALVIGLTTLFTEMQKPLQADALKQPPPPRELPVRTDRPAADEADGDAVPDEQPPPPDPAVETQAKREVGLRAYAVLEQFLGAQSLEERLPIIETTLAEADLRDTPLAGPLPTAAIDTYPQEHNEIERATDCYYGVAFTDERGVTVRCTMLVRKRAEEEPKVVVAPFLDLYGGRLQGFVADPSADGGVFHVVARAVRGRVPDGVPQKRNMFTLKLLADEHESAPTMAEVAVSVNSPIGRKYKEPGPELLWGRASRCLLRLKWNTEDPENPYLEALDMPRLDWNP